MGRLLCEVGRGFVEGEMRWRSIVLGLVLGMRIRGRHRVGRVRQS